MTTNETTQNIVDDILREIDQDAELGWCSNWSDYRINSSQTILVVELADGTEREYSLPSGIECLPSGKRHRILLST